MKEAFLKSKAYGKLGFQCFKNSDVGRVFLLIEDYLLWVKSSKSKIVFFFNKKSTDIELDNKIGWLVGLLRTFFGVFFKPF